MWLFVQPRRVSGTVYYEIAFAPMGPSLGQKIAGWGSLCYLDIFQVTASGAVPVANDLLIDRAMSSIVLTSMPYLAANFFMTVVSYALIRLDVGVVYMVFKNAAGTAPTRWVPAILRLTEEKGITADFTAVGDRLDWVRNNQENVIFPRLKRALGLLGENLVIDNFSYDDASNISGYRMRIFETEAQALTATEDITGMESGEIVQYTVSQTHDQDRNLRELHRSSIDTDQADYAVWEGTGATNYAASPQNTGSWPTGTNVS